MRIFTKINRFRREKKYTPFYKRASFQAIAAIVPILLGITALWTFFVPEELPSGRYVEFLVDASNDMLKPIDGSRSKWDMAVSAVTKTLAYEVHKTDYIAVRTYGGQCDDDKQNTKLLLPFSLDAELKTKEILESVVPNGKSTIESGIVSLTGDFSELEQVKNVDRRVVAIVGSAPSCTGRARDIALNRLQNRYQFEVILIGFMLDQDETRELIEFSRAEFVSKVLFVDSDGQLRKAISRVVNDDKLSLASLPLEFTSKITKQADIKKKDMPLTQEPQNKQQHKQTKATVKGNTLSDLYYSAFENPYNLEHFVNEKASHYQRYYDDFMNCSSLATELARNVEEQLRQHHRVCPNNSVCYQLATDIQTMADIRLNVNNFVTFMNDYRGNQQTSFLNSQIGRSTLLMFNVNQQLNIYLNQNKVFIKHLYFLSNIPCH